MVVLDLTKKITETIFCERVELSREALEAVFSRFRGWALLIRKDPAWRRVEIRQTGLRTSVTVYAPQEDAPCRYVKLQRVTIPLGESQAPFFVEWRVIVGTREVQEIPASLAAIAQIPNTEVRSLLIALLGKNILARQGEEIEFNEHGRALVELGGMTFLVCRNPSPPHQVTVLRVPRAAYQDAEEAAAWTFDIPPSVWKGEKIET